MKVLPIIKTKTQKPAVIFYLLYFFCNQLNAQTIVNVKDEFKEAVIGALVTVKASDSIVFKEKTDANGQIIINEKSGNYKLRIESFSLQTVDLKIQLSDKLNTLEITLKRLENELNEVVIQKRISESQKLRESFYTPEVIDFKDFAGTSKNVIEAVNLGSGVRIQQLGGMGSSVNVNLNGLDGKDVKIFVDEIPVYLLGRGFELQNLTTNMLERVEIYKGLIPVQFGSDALGGVINLSTKKYTKDILAVGYSYGSFNTHEATINTYSHPFQNKKIYTAFDLVYRHSDNNYWMDDVDVVVDDSFNTKLGRARRFNDQYDFGLAKVQIGIDDLSWADSIKLVSSFTYTDKEWQHGITALRPWGEPFSIEYTSGTAINWQKSSVSTDLWNASITAGYNYEYTYFEDVSSKVYYWDGSYIEGQNKGESGLYNQGRTPKTHQNVCYARENASLKLGENFKLNANLFTTKRVLTGEDKAGFATYKQDPFAVPQSILNNFLGFSLESNLLNSRLTSSTSVKHYYNKLKGISFKINNEFDQLNSSSSSDIGFGQLFKWIVSPRFTILPGYEYTIRQPDSREIFGDYITISPNPNLKSAKSHNVNLKLQFKSLDNTFFSGIGGFYRKTQNRIMPASFSNALALYTNLLQTSTIGAEWFLEYKPNRNLNFGINASYQDIRLRDVDDLGVFTPEYIGARVPNTPYFFTNAQLSYKLRPKNTDRYYYSFLYTGSYVHEYFLTWAINGTKSSKAVIPSQFVNDISIAVHSKNERWSFAVDCKNLINAKLYDNFSVQKPGRSFFGKITFLLTD